MYHFQGADGEQGEPGPDGAQGPPVSYLPCVFEGIVGGQEG